MERLSIHGQTRIKKLNPSGRLIRIEGLLYGGHGRVNRGQEGTGRGIQDGSKSSWRIFSVTFKMLLMFSSLEFFNLALVGVPSRRQVIQETVFCVPNLTLLPFQLKKRKNKFTQQNVTTRLEDLVQ